MVRSIRRTVALRVRFCAGEDASEESLGLDDLVGGDPCFGGDGFHADDAPPAADRAVVVGPAFGGFVLVALVVGLPGRVAE